MDNLKFVFYFLLLSGVLLVNAQELRGVVKCEKGERLPFSNIRFLASSRGTVANVDGEFNIFISAANWSDTLEVSHVGFDSKRISLQDFADGQSEIVLTTSSHLLESVTVTPVKIYDRPKEVMNRVFAAIEENYYSRGIVLSGFFRHINYNEQQYTRLLEADVSIYDPGVHSESLPYFNLNQVRKSRDLRSAQILPETVRSMKVKRDVSRLLNDKGLVVADGQVFREMESKNDFCSFWYLYYVNYVRSRQATEDRRLPFPGEMNDEYFDYHRFKIDTILYSDNVPYYRIKILPSRKSEKYMYTKQFIPVGKLLVNGENFAVEEIEYNYILHPKIRKSEKAHWLRINGSLTKFKTIVKYARIGEKYLPSYMYKWEIDPVARNITTKRGSEFAEYNFMSREFFTHNFNVDSTVSPAELAAWNINLYTGDYEYDTDFWQEYAPPLASPLQAQMIEDLENEYALEEQFSENQE